ncbi:MAG: pyridoxamine 5'-phosphate oxidase [Chloroflexi bacterium]|nr:pyridoxamine 5'-phosphate oxidase [Chloroflexota bacterium]
MTNDLRELGRQFQQAGLSERDAPAEPASLINTWLTQATDAGIYLANATVVATVDADGNPTSRTVLLKDVGGRGLVFYTNYESRKARDIAGDPRVACLLVWPGLSRQIRVNGLAARVSVEESDLYFASRERGAQIEAWASDQSTTIPDRETLEERFRHYERKFAQGRVPRPAHWGGYRVSLEAVEFWQGRPDRMHDRLLYEKSNGAWHVSRLAP